jgi:hypothetical protein
MAHNKFCLVPINVINYNIFAENGKKQQQPTTKTAAATATVEAIRKRRRKEKLIYTFLKRVISRVFCCCCFGLFPLFNLSDIIGLYMWFLGGGEQGLLKVF